MATPPQLRVLGAAYGPRDVTEIVRGLIDMKNRSLTLSSSTIKDGSLFGPDPWPGVHKSTVVVYQYGDQRPQVKAHSIALDGELYISYTPERQYSPEYNEMTILGAAWGIKDATQNCQDFVKADGDSIVFNVTAQNSSIGFDGFPGNHKTLVIVWQYHNNIAMIIVKGNTVFSFSYN